MILLVGIMFLVQSFLAWHCVKTGRSKIWVYVIMFLPTIGSILYVITQLLPSLRASADNQSQQHPEDPFAKRAVAVRDVAELRQSKTKLLTADQALPETLHCREQLADECMSRELYGDAEELYLSCLQGTHAQDPTIQLKLAQALFEQSLFARVRLQLEQLIEQNPEFRSPQGHLLYARALEALGDRAVVEEYEALLQNYPGEEARVRYGLYLLARGDVARAESLFTECVSRSRKAPPHYRQSQAEWIALAREQLQKPPHDPVH
ncbi:MAG: hypothetical protein AAF993_14800 [Pseudomonadota bacterium]